MKTEESLSKSEAAALKNAINESARINAALNCIHRGLLASPPKKVLPAIRGHLAELTKSVHEFSAYHNARTTG